MAEVLHIAPGAVCMHSVSSLLSNLASMQSPTACLGSNFVGYFPAADPSRKAEIPSVKGRKRFGILGTLDDAGDNYLLR